MKLNNFVLFCKGWYKRKDDSNPENIWDDVKTVLCGDDYQPETHGDVLYIVINNMTEYFKKDTTAFAMELIDAIHPFNCWKIGYFTKDHNWVKGSNDIIYDHQTAVLYFYMSKIKFLDKNITGKLKEPDPKIMQLNHKMTKENKKMFLQL